MLSSLNKITYQNFIACVKKETPQMGFDYMYRTISYPISFLFFRLGFSPNFISVISIIILCIAPLLFFVYSPLLGFLFFIASYLLDFCDGNVARVIERKKIFERSSQSKTFGNLLENLNTNVSSIIFPLTMSLYVYVQSPSYWTLLVGVILTNITMLYRYTKMHSYLLTQSTFGLKTQQDRDAYFLIKNFFSKSAFNPSTYYIVFLCVYIAVPKLFIICYILYFSLAIVYTTLRFLVVLLRSYAL